MSSSSSWKSGTSMKSVASIGSVTRPRSAAPARSTAIDRSALPTVTLRSRLGWLRRTSARSDGNT